MKITIIVAMLLTGCAVSSNEEAACVPCGSGEVCIEGSCELPCAAAPVPACPGAFTPYQLELSTDETVCVCR